ncbi:hypothetical protein C8F04DRAFT_1186476 [Mycena alexandri]|uniref:MYND-type domain-containing protein n=1 Tax=Mycena alexandri TaxID=1745969 RepID=A0AAD6WZC0_9AGAR|nr:hypothetical protein C8F04DRAFT_1186476 [Mycena alexandri]
MKITELVVGPGDYKLLPSTRYSFPTEYERIEERCWGGMSPDSPVLGLCTDLVDTCLVFVFRCEASGRTTLCHVVSGTDLAVFGAQMDYVTAEDSQSQVEILVFRGIAYGDSGNDVPPEILEQDLQWVSQTLDQIRAKRTSCSASVHPKPLGFGVVLVEKSTAEVTLPTPPSAPTAEPVPAFLHCWPSPATDAKYLKEIRRRQVVDEFYCIQSTASFIASSFTRSPCFEVYDGTRRLPIPPSSDDTREIFRIATMHPNFPAFEPIQQSDVDICKRVVSTHEMVGYVKRLADSISVGAPCEAKECRKLSTQKCSKCRGVYYCSRSHQTEHWAEHKTWCKSHQHIPGGMVGARMEAGNNPVVEPGERMPWM